MKYAAEAAVGVACAIGIAVTGAGTWALLLGGISAGALIVLVEVVVAQRQRR